MSTTQFKTSACQLRASKKYREANRSKCRSISASYYERNKESVKAKRMARYYKSKDDKFKAKLSQVIQNRILSIEDT